jgi:hypothetical protein
MRSSDALSDDIRRVIAGGRTAILTGNVGDFHVGPEGSIVELKELIAYAAAAANLSTVMWTPATGTRQITPPGRASIRFNGPGPSHDFAPPLHRLLQELDRVDQPVLLMVDWASAALGRPDDPIGIVGELLCNAATDAVLARAGHRMLIIDRDGSAARSLAQLPGMRRVAVPLPNFDERVAFLLQLECVHRSPTLASIAEDETIEEVASAANGMSLRALHAHLGELSHQGRRLSTDELWPIKRDFLLQHTDGALRLIPGDESLDNIAGVHNIKLLAEQRRAMPDQAERHMVFVGPPGTGKTTVAAAFGPELGRTAVALGRVHDRFVGGSEERMQLAIDTLEAMAPSLAFVDEVDQTLSGDEGPSGDSGVTKRTNAMFWQWTGRVGPDVPVLMIAATNKPEQLGERVLDRFVVVPVLHPDPTEAADIVRIAAARAGRRVDLTGLAELLVGEAVPMSGRTLAEITHDAAGIADRTIGQRAEIIDRESIQRALADRMPSIGAANEELMALQAVRYTRRRSLLPWNAARLRGVSYVVPACLDRFVDTTGDVDIEALDSRIKELARGRVQQP